MRSVDKGLLRRGIVGLAMAAGIGLTASAAVAQGAPTAGPRYDDRPPIWRGLYGGFHLGVADFDDGDDEFVGGLQIGYNWQANQLVYGLEADATLVDSDAVDALGSVRGRLGFLIQPNILIYATAGLGLVSGSDTETGFVYGVGMEDMISDTISVRIEYLAYTVDNDQADDLGVIRAGLSIKLGR